MPLPHEAIDYLDLAIHCLEKGFIHLYFIANENEAEEFAKNIAKRIGACFNLKKVLPYSPKCYKYCVDLELK